MEKEKIRKSRSRCWHTESGGREVAMYTESGYIVDGVEYATIDEAYESSEDE